jgi:hypothetical protein
MMKQHEAKQKKDKQGQFIIQPKNQTQNGPYIHEKSKQTKTKIETSDACFG